LIQYKLSALHWGNRGFAEFALTRRTVSFILPGLALGNAVALPRQIGLLRSTPSGPTPQSYLCAALVNVSVVLVPFILLLTRFKTGVALLFFGSAAYAALIQPVSIMLAGLVIHQIAYSYYRAQHLNLANLLDVTVLGILPIIGLGVHTRTLVSYITFMGLASLAVSGFAVALAKPFCSGHALVGHMITFARIGLGRMAGELMLIACFGLPAPLAAHTSGVLAAGYVAFGISLLLMIGAALTPFGIVLLPKASELFATGQIAELRSRLLTLLVLCLAITGAITLGLELILPFAIRCFLGHSAPDCVGVSRILVLAAVPYGTYIALRSGIDACHDRPINTCNTGICVIGLVVAAITLRFLHVAEITYILWLFVVALWVLAVLTVLQLRMLVGYHNTAQLGPVASLTCAEGHL
jgi:O-antigen/teichoic acid export membrane protein